MYVVPSIVLGLINGMSMVVKAIGTEVEGGDNNVFFPAYMVYCLWAIL